MPRLTRSARPWRTSNRGGFAAFALDHATGSVVPDGGPLIPFAMISGSSGLRLQRFGGDLATGQAMARHCVAESADAVLGAAAWDGYLTFDGERTDAVFVEACDTTGQPGLLVAQRYRTHPQLPTQTQTLGAPILVERTTPLLGNA